MWAIPEGWLDYAPFDKPLDICGAMLLPVKTPLAKGFGMSSSNPRGLRHDEEFTPTQFIKKLQKRGYDLRMIIDLTFTNRYYKSQEFLSQGVQHVKIKCPGQEVPSEEIYEEFELHLKRFLSKTDATGSFNKEKVVAVHCTHGINRTGYLVCRYLMKHNGMDVKSALAAFKESRGVAIEKNHYITALHRIAAGKQPMSSHSRRHQYSETRHNSGRAHNSGRNEHLQREDWSHKEFRSGLDTSSWQYQDRRKLDPGDHYFNRYSNYGRNRHDSGKFLYGRDRVSSRQTESRPWSPSNRLHGERSHHDVHARSSLVNRSNAQRGNSRRWAPY